MAIIEVNSNQITFDQNEFLNLKSLLPKLQKNFPLEQYEVTTLNVNGEDIDIDSENVNLTRPLVDSDFIKVSIDEKNILFYELTDDLFSLVNKTLEQIDYCTKHLKLDLNAEARLILEKVIDAIEIFIESTSHCYQNLFIDTDDKKSLPIKDLQIHLLSVIKAINTAQKSHDDIMLTDLLEYELKDNLTQWKILILPVLKKQAQLRL